MKPLLLLLSATLAAQAYDFRFRNLRCNRDGSALYFIADARLPGADQPLHGKIFALTEKGVGTLVSFPRIVNDDPAPPSSAVWSMESSFDGEVFSYLLAPICDDIQPCHVAPQGRSFIARRNGQILWEGPGNVRLSPDGRYALLAQPSGTFRLDLSSLTRKLILSGASLGVIAPNGLVFLQYGRPEYHLFREGQWDTYPARSGAIISPDGSTVLYTPQNSGGWRAKNLRTETEIPVPGEPIMTSENGARILTRLTDPTTFRNDYRVFDTSTSQSFSIPGNTAQGLPEIILSPGGKVAFYTQGPAIFKVDVERATAEPILVRPIRLLSNPEPAVPGSLFNIDAWDVFPNRTTTASPPVPTELAGFRAIVDGTPAPVVSINAISDIGRIQIQIPWEVLPGKSKVFIRLDAPRQSPFEGLSDPSPEPDTIEASVATRAPRFLRDDTNTFIQALHQDLERPITNADPARPGEVIHIFLTGLGPLNRPVPTGAAAPTEPPARPLQPLTCSGVPVLDTVLAPGRVGVYRATVAVPSFANGSFSLSCEANFGNIPVTRP
ncbi:MAG: hypothetical protein JNK48_04865 [Bryobacterales bacterium]|nr:hypothetical protein [Bryobacterales bacterium]